ncbi:hypothetical protein OPIT5_00270 (plasmid) [Opitutaceae bacterium TAV5]|nr:hypothetical protein OPIT5_00270 [Opitutaceae bacterium TAV5]
MRYITMNDGNRESNTDRNEWAEVRAAIADALREIEEKACEFAERISIEGMKPCEAVDPDIAWAEARAAADKIRTPRRRSKFSAATRVGDALQASSAEQAIQGTVSQSILAAVDFVLGRHRTVSPEKAVPGNFEVINDASLPDSSPVDSVESAAIDVDGEAGNSIPLPSGQKALATGRRPLRLPGD